MPIVHVESIDDDRLLPYRGLTDRQLRSRLEPAAGVLVAESEKVVRVAIREGLEPLSLVLEDRQLSSQHELVELVLAHRGGADVRMSAGHLEVSPRDGEPDVYVLPHDELSGLVGYNVTRGVLCAMRRPREREAGELLGSMPGARRLAVLEGITDATNVGAAFRGAAALGVDALLLTPTCCDPLVRRAVRVSMGTVFQVPWARLGSWPGAGVGLLRHHGFTTAALALRDDSHALGEPGLRDIDRLAMVFGTEGDGLRPETIEACDLTIRIPMSHGVDSLNVAAATAVAFWDLCR